MNPASSMTTLMWGGVCHTVSVADARALMRAGMAEPSRRQPGRFDGFVFATSEFRTPAEAVVALTGGRAANQRSAPAAAQRAMSFYEAPRSAKAATGRRGAASRRGAWR